MTHLNFPCDNTRCRYMYRKHTGRFEYTGYCSAPSKDLNFHVDLFQDEASGARRQMICIAFKDTERPIYVDKDL